MAGRRSYSKLSRLPAWWLLDKHGRLVASVRATSRTEAGKIFKRDGLAGKRIVRGDT